MAGGLLCCSFCHVAQAKGRRGGRKFHTHLTYTNNMAQHTWKAWIGATRPWSFPASALYTAVHVPSCNFMLIMASLVAGGTWSLCYRLFPQRFTAILLSHAPWEIHSAIAVQSLECAQRLEDYLKSHSGREWVQRHLENEPHLTEHFCLGLAS